MDYNILIGIAWVITSVGATSFAVLAGVALIISCRKH